MDASKGTFERRALRVSAHSAETNEFILALSFATETQSRGDLKWASLSLCD